MKRILLIALATISYSGLANANNGFYASVKAGVSDTKMKDNQVNYFYDDGSYYSHEDYYQHDQSKSIYPNISTAVGFDFSRISNINTRIELEYTYKHSTKFEPTSNYEIWTNTHNTTIYQSKKGTKKFSNELKSQSLMANGYYDFENKSKFTPYLGGGIGLTRVKNDYINLPFPEYNLSKSDNHFTWSTSIGVSYNVVNSVDLDLSYRYVDLGKFKFGKDFKEFDSEETSFKLNSQDYALGIRYTF